jgi:hypothetical protein
MPQDHEIPAPLQLRFETNARKLQNTMISWFEARIRRLRAKFAKIFVDIQAAKPQLLKDGLHGRANVS